MYIHSSTNLTMMQSYSDRVRMVRYSLTEHENVILMTFPLRDGIFCLSAMPKAYMNKIGDKVMKVLKSKSSSNTRSSITGSNKTTRK